MTSVRSTDTGYLVRTERGDWQCRAVVLASGACNIARVPAVADAVPSSITCLAAQQYRNPGQLADGGVLVVGASASGTQIAYEIQRSGRQVYLSVGEHIRAPRMYRGKDIQWWMDAAGVHDERYDAVDDIARARRVPSLQLAGTPDRSTLDLNALTDIGVTLVGRLAGIANGKAQFAGSLRNMCALSDLKMGRLLDTIDAWAHENGLDDTVEPPHRLPPTRVEDSPPLEHRPRRRDDQDDHLGHRLSSRLHMARTAGARPQREWSAMTAGSLICRASISWGCTSCGAGNRR